jgi:Methyltransferase domain
MTFFENLQPETSISLGSEPALTVELRNEQASPQTQGLAPSPEFLTKSIEFVASGVACHCLAMLNRTGALQQIRDTGLLSEQFIESLPNPICIRSAIVTLIGCDIIRKSTDGYRLTTFGAAVVNQIGMIDMFFGAYSDLVARGPEIAMGGCSNQYSPNPSVASAAKTISMQSIESAVIKELKRFRPLKGICDLGCGLGHLLSTVCLEFDCVGLGFEISQTVVNQAQEELRNCPKINVAVGDIRHLSGQWPNIDVLMQCHVFHDFVNTPDFANLIDSYKLFFPNHKYFIYIDTVSPSASCPSIFPGFDYVHGLMGILTPTYEETITAMRKQGYSIRSQQPIVGMPSTFLWIFERDLEQ